MENVRINQWTETTSVFRATSQTDQQSTKRGFLLSSYDRDDVAEIHGALSALLDQFGGTRDTNRYLVLGSYDDEKIELLRDACSLIENEDPAGRAILLSELNIEDKSWDNFYLKFKYTETITDHFVVVAEDNDGGHELELGEIDLSRTYISKRNYANQSLNHRSIDGGLEREKFDAMLAKLFESMGEAGRLWEWESVHSFARSIRDITRLATDSGPSSRQRALGSDSPTETTDDSGTSEAASGSPDSDAAPRQQSDTEPEQSIPDPVGSERDLTWPLESWIEQESSSLATVVFKRRLSSPSPSGYLKLKIESYEEREWVEGKFGLIAALSQGGRDRHCPIVYGTGLESMRERLKAFAVLYEHYYRETDDPHHALDLAKSEDVDAISGE